MATDHSTTDHLFPESKQCSQCKKIKSLDDFYSRKNGKNNKRAECKQCCIETAARWVKEHPKENRIKSAKYRAKFPERVEATRRRNYHKYAPAARTQVKNGEKNTAEKMNLGRKESLRLRYAF